MPLDQTNWSQTETETKPDLSKPSLEGLSWLLRHKEEWPRLWNWDFNYVSRETHCGTAGCAIGLAWHQWGECPFDDLRRQFGMGQDDYYAIFGVVNSDNYSPHYRKDRSLVSEREVADAIDAYLAETRK